MNTGNKEFNELVVASANLAIEIGKRFNTGITETEYEFYKKMEAYTEYVLSEVRKQEVGAM